MATGCESMNASGELDEKDRALPIAVDRFMRRWRSFSQEGGFGELQGSVGF